MIYQKKKKIVNELSTKNKSIETIGTINWRSVRGEVPLTEEDKLRLKNISYAYVARLAGLIDGDGYIAVVASDSKRKYASIRLTIMLMHNEIDMLVEMKNILGIGRINGPYSNKKGEKVIAITFNKTELQQVLFPLFVYHDIFFLTLERRNQFEKAIYIMESNTKKKWMNYLLIYLLQNTLNRIIL